MHSTAARYQETVRDEHGLDVTVEELPEGTHSAADAAEAIGCPLGAIVKSVVLLVEGGDDAEYPVIAYASGEHHVDEAALAAHLDAAGARTADPDEVKEYTGWSIGGVPPVGHGIERTLLDESLLEHEEIWGGAGTPEAVAAFDPEAVVEAADAEIAAVFE
jgi:prolyl-tRNA editing enzyme YbaK/EbsC (Cys-tRNA(Pro) deacylase)